MVFVKVRETYDLHTLANKMSVIGIHTPGSGILKRNYPGLLMQCKMYRPVSCDVRLACASMLPVDPQGVGTSPGDIAPEDLFNPILYKAVSNKGMSQIEKYLNAQMTGWVARGDSIDATNNGVSSDDFNMYYGLLSNTHEWKHANPQSGLSMSSLRPIVYERLYNIGDNGVSQQNESVTSNVRALLPSGEGTDYILPESFVGSGKEMPFINCTAVQIANDDLEAPLRTAPGFPTNATTPSNWEVGVPAPKIYCGIIIVPPSRLHELFYRLVCEWTIEFSSIRPLSEIASFAGLGIIGNAQHVMSYSFGSKILTEETELIDTTEGSEIKKVM